MKYKRVLLKLSGEALAGDDHFGINANTVADIARQIKEAKDLGVEIAIVCGGGNMAWCYWCTNGYGTFFC